MSPYASELKIGDLFKLELDRPLMGQSPEITEMVKQLQVGEEVVAKIDELSVFNRQEQGNSSPHSSAWYDATPHQRVPVAPATEPEVAAVDPTMPEQEAMPMPSTQAPQQAGRPATRSAASTFVSVRTVNGVTERIEVIK